MNATKMSEFLKLVGPIADFKPCARYSITEVIVLTKDCSYTSEWVSVWLSIFSENHRPWYKPWKKYVGFELHCPPELKLSGEVPVTVALDCVAKRPWRNTLFAGTSRWSTGWQKD